MTKVCSFEEAVAGIKDGQTVATVGVIGWITPDKTLAALAERFRKTGAPKNLTFYFPCGTGDGQDIPGMDRVAIPGLMKRHCFRDDIALGEIVGNAEPMRLSAV